MRCDDGTPRRQGVRRTVFRLMPLVLLVLAFWGGVGTGIGAAFAAATTVGIGCPAARSQALDLPVTRTALARNQPVVIVAFGSSSTEGSGATTPHQTYPARLQALLRAAWPGRSIHVLNRGRGGQTTQEMLARLNADVLAVSPTLVIWQNGANATLRDMDTGHFAALTRDGVGKILARGSDLILMDNQLAPRILVKPHHAAYGDILAREAAKAHVSLFSRTALMRDWAAADPGGPAMIGEDRLHHTDRGYACLAAALAREIETAVAADAEPVTRPEARAASGFVPPGRAPRRDRLSSRGNRVRARSGRGARPGG